VSILDSDLRKELALTQLVLQTSSLKSTERESTPSDELLAAMLENRLDVHERNHVLEYIANDYDTYQRWINLVETFQELQSLNDCEAQRVVEQVKSKTVDPTISTKNSLINRLSQWLLSQNGLSATFATAAAIVISIILIPTPQPYNVSDDLTGFYDTIDVQLIAELNNSNVLGKQFSDQRNFKLVILETPTQRAIASGFAIGANRLSPQIFANMGFPVGSIKILSTKQIPELEEDEYSILFELGRFSALATLRCLENNAASLKQLYPTAKRLIFKLDKSKLEITSFLSQNFQNNIDENLAVCSLSSDINQTILISQ